jgi:hypothetical protein
MMPDSLTVSARAAALTRAALAYLEGGRRHRRVAAAAAAAAAEAAEEAEGEEDPRGADGGPGAGRRGGMGRLEERATTAPGLIVFGEVEAMGYR